MPLTARQRSIHSKNGTKRSASFNKGRTRKNSEGEYLVTNAPTDLRSIAYPGGAVTLVLLLTVRITNACWGTILDCDETYNYWEPLHYMVYGSGFQTWEYSPEYAIRSYVPLWLLAVPARFASLLVSPVTIFYGIRVLLASFTAVAELMFYKAVCHEFGVHVGRAWLAFAVPAAGCAAAAGSLLPSAWTGALATAAAAAWWRRRYGTAVLFTGVNALIGWPFTALLGVPIAIDMILKRKFTDLVRWSLLTVFFVLVPAAAVDSWYYGRPVAAAWNIIVYNVLGGPGPALYGVEPWTYYFVNGFLNFNVVWILALACPLLLGACAATTSAAPRAPFCLPYWLSLQPLYLWLLVFCVQPHKEERFLYPVYSMIVLAGAISLDCVQKLSFAVTERLRWRRERRHYLACTAALFYVCVAVAGLGGLSRTISLYNNYHGTMTVLSPARGDVTVCYGKEWHRSPSSFFVDGEMRFVESEFAGQMPAPYSRGYNATRLVHPYFNDANRGDNRTYLPAARCHYLVDSDLAPSSPRQPHYHTTDVWDIVRVEPLLDAARSPPALRAFHVPVLSARRNVYGHLYLLKNKKLAV